MGSVLVDQYGGRRLARRKQISQTKEVLMDYLKLCDSDYRFMSIVWEHAPVPSGELVRICGKELGWKKSTVYTTIKKLSEKGYIKNENAVVMVLIAKERVQKDESNYFVERTFGGSLPQFLNAFLGGKKISEKEAEKIRKIIDAASGKGGDL